MYFFSFRSQSCREKTNATGYYWSSRKVAHTGHAEKSDNSVINDERNRITPNFTLSLFLSLFLSLYLSLSFSLFFSFSLSIRSRLDDLEPPRPPIPPYFTSIWKKKNNNNKRKKKEKIYIFSRTLPSLMIFFKLIACCLFIYMYIYIYIYTYIFIYNVINIRYEHMFGFFALLRLH